MQVGLTPGWVSKYVYSVQGFKVVDRVTGGPVSGPDMQVGLTPGWVSKYVSVLKVVDRVTGGPVPGRKVLNFQTCIARVVELHAHG